MIKIKPKIQEEVNIWLSTQTTLTSFHETLKQKKDSGLLQKLVYDLKLNEEVKERHPQETITTTAQIIQKTDTLTQDFGRDLRTILDAQENLDIQKVLSMQADIKKVKESLAQLDKLS